MPLYNPASGGSAIDVSGTPTTNQVATWVDADTLQGVSYLKEPTTGSLVMGTGAAPTISGFNSTIIGQGAGAALISGTATDGASNVIIGSGAGGTTTTGRYCVLIGHDAGGDGDFREAALGQVFIGYEAGKVFARTAVNFGPNVCIGHQTGVSLTTGDGHVLIGHNAGAAVTTSVQVTAIGASAGAAFTGSLGVFVGAQAGDTVTSGGSSVYIGAQAGKGITTGSSNVFLGAWAGAAYGTTLSHCVFIGDSAGGVTATGNANIAIGTQTLGALTSGVSNVAVGYKAGLSHSTASQCVYVGASAGLYATGESNTVVGEAAFGVGSVSGSGERNVALGRRAMLFATTEEHSVAIGYQAGDNMTAGSNNIAIGYLANTATAAGSNQLSIGNSLYGDISNHLFGIGVTNTSFPSAGTKSVIFGNGTAPSTLAADTWALHAKDLSAGVSAPHAVWENGITGLLATIETKTDTGDPTGYEGRCVINTFDNTLKLYADGGWRTLASGW